MDGSTGHPANDIEQEKDVIAVNKPLFKLGQVVATPGAIEALERAKQTPWSTAIAPCMLGRGAIVGTKTEELNNEALKDGSRILSAYILNDEEDENLDHHRGRGRPRQPCGDNPASA